MKTNITILIVLILFSGCEKVLDKKALDGIDDTDVWHNESLANLYLNRVYDRVLPTFGGGSNTNISDESTGSGVDNMMYGELSNSSPYGTFGVNIYNNIRRINILLDEIDNGTIAEGPRNELKGQAMFLRAWVYWELVKLYGGVPMVMTAQDPFEGELLWMTRNSAEFCIELIIKDMDDAIAFLPTSWPASERGRITRGAAAALKGRILLFYASPQFNPDNHQDRWEVAYQANKDAKEICLEDGYQLHNDFGNIFIDEDNNKEAIFITGYDGVNKLHGYENSVRPSIASNSGGNTNNPTWEFVKSFPMLDGSPVENHPGYDSLYFWENRDPRFYETVAYNGAIWELTISENVSQFRQWNYIGSEEPPSPDLGATNTGFYCRKNVNTAIPKEETGRVGTDWIEIRYAEVLLNLAECAAELNLLDEAKTELIEIRKRAGIEEGDGSYGITATNKLEMIESVIKERQIELAFENKRHWDLRRRNMYVEDLGNNKKLNGTRRHGIQTHLVYPEDSVSDIAKANYALHFNNNVRDTIDLDNDYYNYFITEFGWVRDEKDINFLQPQYNFYFIPQSDLDKNPNLQQTIYWGEIDPFDPLAD